MLLTPKVPTVGDLNNAVDITDYVTSDGVQFEHELDPVIEAFRSIGTRVVMTAEIIEGLAQLREHMRPHYAEPRAMNTTMQYPTSTPPWGRRKR